MAIIHQATLTPSKAETLATWLSAQPWFGGTAEVTVPVAAYRFDDPAGEVGMEAFFVEVGGRTVHVPVTYRGAPLPGGDEWLVGTMEHSVLGTRWVYDAVGDPVYRAELTRVVREGGTHVRLMVETPDGPVEREPTAFVRGSGSAAGQEGEPEIVVVRFPSADAVVPSEHTLTGTWTGQDEPAVLAYLVPPTV